MYAFRKWNLQTVTCPRSENGAWLKIRWTSFHLTHFSPADKEFFWLLQKKRPWAAATCVWATLSCTSRPSLQCGSSSGRNCVMNWIITYLLWSSEPSPNAIVANNLEGKIACISCWLGSTFQVKLQRRCNKIIHSEKLTKKKTLPTVLFSGTSWMGVIKLTGNTNLASIPIVFFCVKYVNLTNFPYFGSSKPNDLSTLAVSLSHSPAARRCRWLEAMKSSICSVIPSQVLLWAPTRFAMLAFLVLLPQL